MVELIEVDSGPHLESIRSLFLEYAQSLDFNSCFQSFDREMQDLPRPYAPPEGRLILSTVDGKLAGCIALKSLGGGFCEMKRLYVRPEFRGHGLGLKMTLHLIDEARGLGYPARRLDTIFGRQSDTFDFVVMELSLIEDRLIQ